MAQGSRGVPTARDDRTVALPISNDGAGLEIPIVIRKLDIKEKQYQKKNVAGIC